MSASQLLAAYDAYAVAYKQWEADFDLATILDRPEAPEQSVEALAGEIIHDRGSLRAAVVEAQAGIEDPDCPERRKEAYQRILSAAGGR